MLQKPLFLLACAAVCLGLAFGVQKYDQFERDRRLAEYTHEQMQQQMRAAREAERRANQSTSSPIVRKKSAAPKKAERDDSLSESKVTPKTTPQNTPVQPEVTPSLDTTSNSVIKVGDVFQLKLRKSNNPPRELSSSRLLVNPLENEKPWDTGVPVVTGSCVRFTVTYPPNPSSRVITVDVYDHWVEVKDSYSTCVSDPNLKRTIRTWLTHQPVVDMELRYTNSIDQLPFESREWLLSKLKAISAK